MVTTVKCQYCRKAFEAQAEDITAFCPYCGRETRVVTAKETGAKFTAARWLHQHAALALIIILGGVICLLAALLTASQIANRQLESKIRSKADSTAARKTTKHEYPPPLTDRMEFTAKLMDDFPERVSSPGSLEGNLGWMDGEFCEIDNDEMGFYSRLDSSTMVGFSLTDKKGDMFHRCYAAKAKYGDFLLSLKSGDRIRITGQAMMFREQRTTATFDAWLRADSIQLVN